MKYEQDRNASGEILRTLIKKMAEHPAAFTPLNYAVWYEHITGINPALSGALVILLDKKETLDDNTIEKLYLQFISEFNMNIERTLREQIQPLLIHIADLTDDTNSEANHFGNSLQAYNKILKQNLDPPKLAALINNMIGDTNKMLNAIQNMHLELVSCKQKGEELFLELQNARGEALIDPLTGVLNRRGFENNAKQLFAEQTESDKKLCLLMLDIDHFKKINDSYGHLFGDKVIQAIAETLKSKVRGQDSIARLGGEEFSVLLPETDISGARAVAEHIRKTIEECKIYRHGTQERIGGVTVSIGIVAYVKGYSLMDMLDQADKALFISKEQGRNKTTVYVKQ